MFSGARSCGFIGAIHSVDVLISPRIPNMGNTTVSLYIVYVRSLRILWYAEFSYMLPHRLNRLDELLNAI